MISQLVWHILIPVFTFISGIVIGYFIGCAKKNWENKPREQRQLSNWGPALITIVVTIIWALSSMLDIALDTYETPLPLHGIMGGIVGYFFNKEIVKRRM